MAGISLLSLCSAAYAVDFEDINIHGSVSQTYLHTTTNEFLIENSEEGSFEFSEILLNVSSDLTDQLRVGAQLISRDFGAQGNFKTDLDWGYGDYNYDEKLGVRLGKVRTPLGFHNEYRDVDGGRNAILLDQGMYFEETRSITLAYSGIGVYGNLPSFNDQGDFEYHFYLGRMNVPEGSRLVDQIWEGVSSSESEMDSKFAGGGQVIYNTPLDGLRLQGSHLIYRGSMDLTMSSAFGTLSFAEAFDFDTKITNFGLEYMYDRFTLTGEYQQIQSDAKFSSAYRAVASNIPINIPPITTNFAALVLDPMESGSSNDTQSWYVQLDHQCNDVLNAFLRYSEVKGKDNPGALTSHRNDLTLGIRYDINSHLWFKTEYHHMRGKLGIRSELPNRNTAQDNEDWGAFAARITFTF